MGWTRLPERWVFLARVFRLLLPGSGQRHYAWVRLVQVWDVGVRNGVLQSRALQARSQTPRSTEAPLASVPRGDGQLSWFLRLSFYSVGRRRSTDPKEVDPQRWEGRGLQSEERPPQCGLSGTPRREYAERTQCVRLVRSQQDRRFQRAFL